MGVERGGLGAVSSEGFLEAELSRADRGNIAPRPSPNNSHVVIL